MKIIKILADSVWVDLLGIYLLVISVIAYIEHIHILSAVIVIFLSFVGGVKFTHKQYEDQRERELQAEIDRELALSECLLRRSRLRRHTFPRFGKKQRIYS